MTCNPLRASLAALALLLAAGARPAHAADWRFHVLPYVWATDVGVDVRVDGRQVVDRTIPVSDLLEDLDTILQVRAEAQKGPHGVMLDLFDVNLSDEATGVAIPQGAGLADVNSDIGMTILDLAGMYDPKGDRQGVAFLYGMRMLDERATIDATITPTGGMPTAVIEDVHDTMLDALAGVRYRRSFTRHWGAQLQAEASTGATDWTWSAASAFGYSFGEYGQFGVTAGYRTMTVDFADDGDVAARMTMSGLLVGFRASF